MFASNCVQSKYLDVLCRLCRHKTFTGLSNSWLIKTSLRHKYTAETSLMFLEDAKDLIQVISTVITHHINFYAHAVPQAGKQLYMLEICKSSFFILIPLWLLCVIASLHVTWKTAWEYWLSHVNIVTIRSLGIQHCFYLDIIYVAAWWGRCSSADNMQPTNQ